MIDYDEKDVQDFSALELPGEEVIEEEDEYNGEDDEDTVVEEGTLAVRIQALIHPRRTSLAVNFNTGDSPG